MKRFLLFAPIVFLLVNCQVSEIPVTTGVTAELAKHRKTIISEIQ